MTGGLGTVIFYYKYARAFVLHYTSAKTCQDAKNPVDATIKPGNYLLFIKSIFGRLLYTKCK
jgi:hypothetical protein